LGIISFHKPLFSGAKNACSKPGERKSYVNEYTGLEYTHNVQCCPLLTGPRSGKEVSGVS